jgi:hypothetical protein
MRPAVKVWWAVWVWACAPPLRAPMPCHARQEQHPSPCPYCCTMLQTAQETAFHCICFVWHKTFCPSGSVQVQNLWEAELNLGSGSIRFRFKVHKNLRTRPKVQFLVWGNLALNWTELDPGNTILTYFWVTVLLKCDLLLWWIQKALWKVEDCAFLCFLWKE